MSKDGLKGSESFREEAANTFLTLEEVLGLTRDQGISENLAYIQERLALALVGQTEANREARQSVTRIINNLTVLVNALGRDDQSKREVMRKLIEIDDLTAHATLGLQEDSGSRPRRQVFEDDPGLDFRHYTETDDEDDRQGGDGNEGAER